MSFVKDLVARKVELLEYMKQDIYLLGGIMQRAQDIYWCLYEIDIVDKITLSSLALALFRKKYYYDEKTPISIPTRNVDSFIRLTWVNPETATETRGELSEDFLTVAG